MANSSTPIAWVSKFLSLTNKWSLYLSLLVWPFGHLLKIGQLYLLDFFVFVVFLSFFFDFKNKNQLSTDLAKAMHIFWFALLVSIFYNFWLHTPQSVSNNFLYYLRAMSYPFLAFSYHKHSSTDLNKITLFSVSLFTILCLLQYVFLPDLRIYKNLGFDDHFYRLAGPLLDPNFTGAIFSTFAIYFLIYERYLFGFISLVCLSLTFSRASYLSFILPVFFLYLQKSKKQLFIVVALLMVLVFISPKPFGEGVNLLRTYSISSRLLSVDRGLNIFSQRPLFGHGFGQILDPSNKKVSIDNTFVYLLAGSGICGFLTFIYLLLKIFQGMPKTLAISLLPILIHSLFNNSFFYIWIMALFWVVVGIGLKGSKSA